MLSLGNGCCLTFVVPPAGHKPLGVAVRNLRTLVGVGTHAAVAVGNNLAVPALADHTLEAEPVDVLAEDKKWYGSDDAKHARGVTKEVLAVYVSYLIKIGFLPKPEKTPTVAIPDVKISEESIELIRSGAGARTSAN
ncbi:hypothetical protein JL09_g1816 [Pichia kudriavzevii]|uniref:Uncharacterized protein n=1 Tax=Pichia kudriavzevii TaxID=4909 RepID=A0A099P441_PICKU|nr:hypothetical protein JL09_g1816 [Pichia kudriavzevii]